MTTKMSRHVGLGQSDHHARADTRNMTTQMSRHMKLPGVSYRLSSLSAVVCVAWVHKH